MWSAPPGVEYVNFGNWQQPFSISIPTEATELAASAQTLREWKVIWKLEVLVDHQPIPYVGWRIAKAYNLNLHNYRLPNLPPLSPPQANTVGSDSASTQIFLNSPHGAFGPGDMVNISFHAKPDDSTTVVKKASVLLERRVELLDSKPSPKHISRNASPESAGSARLSSFFRRSSSPRPRFHRIASDPTSPAPDLGESGRIIRDKVAEVICEQLTPGSGGTYWCSTALELPKRGGKWNIGETVVTGLVSVTYELKVKITVKTTRPRVVCREYTCLGIPVTIAAVSAADRNAATATLSAIASSSKSSTPRRKHRSSRRGLYMHEGSVDISDPIISSCRRRGMTRSATSSPVLSSVAGIANNVTPILLPPHHPTQPHSISFIFPSPRPNDSPSQRSELRGTQLPTVDTLIHPINASAPPFLHTPSPIGSTPSFPSKPLTPSRSDTSHVSPSSPLYLSPPDSVDYESLSILRRFQHTGRRISTTNSEEEEMQPCRSRQKLREEDLARRAKFDFRTTLPSLDALGLGLPQLPDDGRPIRRPSTAPMHSTFAARAIPPPLSGVLSAGQEITRPTTLMTRRASEIAPLQGSFAFTVRAHAEGRYEALR